MPDPRNLLGKLAEAAEQRLGITAMPVAQRDLLEAGFDELRQTNRELDLLGWHVLDYLGGQPLELNTASRKKMVQRARHVWMNDPQAGASVSLMNDFTFGRGVPVARAKDKIVQEKIDDFWNDPDNKRALTTYGKQMQLGTDLALQSNIFFEVFDDGEDGKVKLSVCDHDTVENCVRDPANPSRVLYWLIRPRVYAWDFSNDRPMTDPGMLNKPPLYYEDWNGMKEALEEQDAGARDIPIPKAPANRVGKGRIYHVAINRFSGQVFGVPEFQRTIRWYSAYNDFMKARVDVAQASAAFIMKRKVKGTPNQLARLASKAISREGDIAGRAMDASGNALAPPRPGSILTENDSVEHENFNLNSNAGNAQQDAHMIRAPISAATRFPQSYYGDESNTSLAAATSLELPVLKAVESRQEVFEQLFRDMIDRVIERAVETNQISEERTPEEIADEMAKLGGVQQEQQQLIASLREAGCKVLSYERRVVGSKREGYTLRETVAYEDLDGELQEAHEDKTVDEESTQRELGYDFSMPSPLRRMMGDLVGAVQQTAATFDPNNTNLELTKQLATIVFGEAFEIQDPADLVEKIWPPGYVDPMIAAAQAQSAPPNAFGPQDAGKPIPHAADGAYPGAPTNSRLPEELRSGPYNAMEAEVDLAKQMLSEAVQQQDFALAWELTQYLHEAVSNQNDLVRARARGQVESVATMFDKDVAAVAMNALNRHVAPEPEVSK